MSDSYDPTDLNSPLLEGVGDEGSAPAAAATNAAPSAPPPAAAYPDMTRTMRRRPRTTPWTAIQQQVQAGTLSDADAQAALAGLPKNFTENPAPAPPATSTPPPGVSPAEHPFDHTSIEGAHQALKDGIITPKGLVQVYEQHADVGRPNDIDPAVWRSLNPSQKQEAIARDKAEAPQPASDGTPPAIRGEMSDDQRQADDANAPEAERKFLKKVVAENKPLVGANSTETGQNIANAQQRAGGDFIQAESQAQHDKDDATAAKNDALDQRYKQAYADAQAQRQQDSDDYKKHFADLQERLNDHDARVKDLMSQKVDPDHLYNSKGTGRHVLDGVAAFLGAFNPSGHNLALEQIKDATDRDVNAQMTDLANKRAGLAEEGTSIHDRSTMALQDSAYRSQLRSENLTTALAQVQDTMHGQDNPIVRANGNLLQAQLKRDLTQNNLQAAQYKMSVQRSQEQAAAAAAAHRQARFEKKEDVATEHQNKVTETGAEKQGEIEVDAAKPTNGKDAKAAQQVKALFEPFGDLKHGTQLPGTDFTSRRLTPESLEDPTVTSTRAAVNNVAAVYAKANGVRPRADDPDAYWRYLYGKSPGATTSEDIRLGLDRSKRYLTANPSAVNGSAGGNSGDDEGK
jgi:hypothetical protein